MVCFTACNIGEAICFQAETEHFTVKGLLV